ncbi:MAG TPA: hypothetical protein VFB10_06860 [Candidatus Dormibacteraeota bacterium]|nr:hypothetical protein [Candidatus Dormibacteraeota bacterium]
MSRKSRGVDVGLLSGLAMAGAVVWVVLAAAPKSDAIPAFSRKYQTSCTTCHNNYPELNDFGEAFKKNGFKFPKDDETFVKQDQVLLGSKAQKEAFPGAVYPGEIPGTVPIAFRYEGNFNWNANRPAAVVAANGLTPRTDLFVPNTFTIISAGSFGPNLSFWIDDDISAGGSGANGGLGDAWLKYNDLGRVFHLPTNFLNVRFGQFELDLPFTQARTPYLSGYDVLSEPAVAPGPACGAGVTQCQTVNNSFVLGAPQRGIEFGGYADNYNFNWSVAYVDGTGSAYGGTTSLVTRNTKDVYLRASYRFNLERDPESRNGIQAAGPTGPHDHTSIRVGAFYYHGTNQQNFAGTTYGFGDTINEPFYRAGGDIRFKYRKLELFGVGLVGHDENHFVDTEAATIVKAPAVTFTGGFVAANYWVYPWLIATMRYDFVNSPSDLANGVARYQTRNAFRPGYQILLRANIKIVGEYDRAWEPSSYGAANGIPLYYRPNTFVTGIDYVF